MRVQTTELRCTSGTSFKQYTIKVFISDTGHASVQVAYGRIGSKAVSYTKIKDVTEQKALAEAQRLIDQKLRKGYVHTQPGPGVSSWIVDPSAPPAPAVVATKPAESTNASLASLSLSRRRTFAVSI